MNIQQVESTPPAQIRMVAGSVTSAMATWVMSKMILRLQQQCAFADSRWHPGVPQMHIDSIAMGGHVKRIVLLVFTLWPV